MILIKSLKFASNMMYRRRDLIINNLTRRNKIKQGDIGRSWLTDYRSKYELTVLKKLYLMQVAFINIGFCRDNINLVPCSNNTILDTCILLLY